MLAWPVLLAAAAGVLSAAPASGSQPAPQLVPEITFTLDDPRRSPDQVADEEDAAEGLAGWRVLARKAAGLQQLDCTDDMLGATTRMVDEAERGDTLAMAALGVMCT